LDISGNVYIMQDFRGYTAITLPPFLLHMRYACPGVVPVNPCAGHLVELLQLQAAYLADLTVFDLDLGVVA
jgi:hypothetical protein